MSQNHAMLNARCCTTHNFIRPSLPSPITELIIMVYQLELHQSTVKHGDVNSGTRCGIDALPISGVRYRFANPPSPPPPPPWFSLVWEQGGGGKTVTNSTDRPRYLGTLPLISVGLRHHNLSRTLQWLPKAPACWDTEATGLLQQRSRIITLSIVNPILFWMSDWMYLCSMLQTVFFIKTTLRSMS